MIGYYYCSLDTFLNIVKNRQIYLYDPLKMNDSSEIIWHIERLKKEKENHNDFESMCDIMEVITGFEFTFDELISTLKSKGQNSIYISCFSKDSDILSQWRAYADDGKGVCIGFDLDKLAQKDNILIRNVIYTNKENIAEDGGHIDRGVVAPWEISTVIS